MRVGGDTEIMRESPLKPEKRRIDFLSLAIIVLVVATALIHLWLGVRVGPMGGPGGGRPPGQIQAAGTPAAGIQPSSTPQANGQQTEGGPAANGQRPQGGPGGGGIMSLIPVPLSTLFILNFVGYIVLVVALYLPQLRRFQPIVRWILIGYAALTIVLWYLFTGGHLDLDDVTDKVIEVALIVLLVIEGWGNRRVQVR